MPYLMTDMAAGSTAALQMQKNMAAAPYVEQQAAAEAQATQIELQQKQATLARTKLQNTIAETGFDVSEKARAKLAAMANDPKFAAADDAGKLRMGAIVSAELGDVETFSKNLTAAQLADSRKLAADELKHKQAQHQIEQASSVIAAWEPDQVAENFSRLPKESQDSILAAVGEENWNKMTGEQKKEAAANLMFKGNGQLRLELKKLDLQRAAIAEEERTRRAVLTTNLRIQARLAGKGSASGDDSDKWETTVKRLEAVDKISAKSLDRLEKQLEDAQATADKSIPWYSSKPSDAAGRAVDTARKQLNDYKRDMLKKKWDLVVSSPDFPGRDVFMDSIKRELGSFAEDAPAPKVVEPAKQAGKPTTLQGIKDKQAGGGATSNKLTPDQQATVSKAEAAIKAGADPQKVKERLKQAGIPGY